MKPFLWKPQLRFALIASIVFGTVFASENLRAQSAPPDPTPDPNYPNLFYGATPPPSAHQPVVVFVAGLSGTASDFWQGNDMYSRAYAAGYRTAFMSMSADNSRNTASSQDNAVVIQSLLPVVLQHYKASKVYFVGHSKGGLDIQYAMMSPTTLNSVKGVFTLDTPNQGTALADCVQTQGTLCYGIGQVLKLNTPGLQSLQTAAVAQFRAIADPIFAAAGIQFYTTAGTTNDGNLITLVDGKVLSNLVPNMRNDGLVTVTESQLPYSYAAEIKEIYANHFTVLQGSVSFPFIRPRIDAQELDAVATPDGSNAMPEFSRIATGGFGDDNNTFNFSMEWFEGKLYVGTGRAVNCVSHAIDQVQTGAKTVYPVFGCPADMKDLQLQAEIWAYTPQTKSWARVFQSPNDISLGMDQSGNPAFTAEDIVFRGMAVFTEADGTQALYVAGVSASAMFDNVAPYNAAQCTAGVQSACFPNPRILRSTDGVNFAPIPMDWGTYMGMLVPNSPEEFKVRGFRDLTVYNGSLYATPSDYIGTGFVIGSSNPSQGDNAWQAVSPATATLPVRTLYSWNGFLWICGGDPRVGPAKPGGGNYPDGYFVYKTTSPTPDMSTYIPIITEGAGMPLGDRSTDVLSVADFNGQLYIGTDRPTEMVRINTDDSWQLLIGIPRQTQFGYQNPLTGLSSGLGNTMTGHFYRMAVFNNELYMGTWDWSDSFIGIDPLNPLLLYEFGTDLYKTPDGISWSAVTHNGFNDVNNFGIRALQTTPFGLFLGTTRPIGGAQVWLNQHNLDYNGDGEIDQNDVNVILSALNTSANGPNDPRDLDGDGKITVLDARLLTTQCTNPNCAVASVILPLPPPANLTAVSSLTSSATASLSWTASPGAVKYHVFRSTMVPIFSYLPPNGIAIPLPGVPFLVNVPNDIISGKLSPYCDTATEPASLPCLLIDAVETLYQDPSIGTPLEWAEVAVTTTPFYQEAVPTADPSRYVVKADDGNGNLSVPSNIVVAPSYAAADSPN